MIPSLVVVAAWVVVEVGARPGRPARSSGRRATSVVLLVLVGVAAAWLIGPMSLGVPLIGGGVVVVRRRRGARAEAAALDASRADLADLFAVVVGAGGTVSDALREAAERGPRPVRGPVASVLRDADRGLGVVAALQRTDAFGPGYASLLASLVAAERDGVPLGTVVARLGDEARAAASALHHERVQQLPVRLLAPLTLCCLPAVVIGALVPLALAHLGDLR